jgi:hypothetical protein
MNTTDPVLAIVASEFGRHVPQHLDYDPISQTALSSAARKWNVHNGTVSSCPGNAPGPDDDRGGGAKGKMSSRTAHPVLIVTNSNDPHADAIIERLDYLSVPVIRWHPDELSTDADVALCGNQISVSPSVKCDRTFTVDAIRSVWIRRPIAREPTADTLEGRLSERYEILENDAVFRNVMACISAPFINPLSSLDRAHNKILQLLIARRFFAVPEYVVSNRRNVLVEFASTNTDLVIKPLNVLSAYIIEQSHAIRCDTKLLTMADLSQFPTRLPSPAWVQRRIMSVCDVRLTVIGQYLCAVRIETDSDLEVDTRSQLATAVHSPCAIPDRIEIGVRQFMHEFELRFGGFDFLIDRDGKWWFLECNASGQFLWIDEMTNVDLAGVMAETLAGIRPL